MKGGRPKKVKHGRKRPPKETEETSSETRTVVNMVYIPPDQSQSSIAQLFYCSIVQKQGVSLF